MGHRRIATVAALLGLALCIVCVGLASASATTYRLHATLTAGQQVPPQTVKTPKASATFTGTLVLDTKTGTLTWQMKSSGLSSPIKSAYILFPAKGKQMQVSIGLCSGKGCASTAAARSSMLSPTIASVISGRAGYVTIVTAKNPQGEVRGKLVATS